MQDQPTDQSTEPVPFGAMEPPPAEGKDGAKKDYRREENRRGGARRGGRRRRKPAAEQPAESGADAPAGDARPETAVAVDAAGGEAQASGNTSGSAPAGEAATDGRPREGRRRRRRRRRPGQGGQGGQGGQAGQGGPGEHADRGDRAEGQGRRQGRGRAPSGEAQETEGMFVLDKGGFGTLRMATNQFMPSKQDVFVPKALAMRNKLRDGALIKGKAGRGQGKHKFQLVSVETVDGREPGELGDLTAFKKLVSIDPDFHYEVGDTTDNVSMRILDLICPIGRGTRGLIVAPPRSGKTILMREFAAGIEEAYPDVHLMVLLVDERPEEATEWQRSIKNGQVFVSTNDEMSKHHVQLAEAVWKRATRLVELGEDVILLLDSITRLARAYNNSTGGSGRTMSGGIDSRTMEKPRAFFGSARNTETAGSLTILGTTLVETGSRMDQVIFEEFKGTGNMELVLSRKLADRRIFPAIDIERSGTRKEEKLLSAKKHKRVTILRRVLLKMHFTEAMELLVTKLEEVEKTDDFLKRFEVDPEA
jgi:transcription termination factor Rho